MANDQNLFLFDSKVQKNIVIKAKEKIITTTILFHCVVDNGPIIKNKNMNIDKNLY